MQEPMVPLTDGELALVTSATTADGLKALVEQIRDYITQGHRAGQDARSFGTLR